MTLCAAFFAAVLSRRLADDFFAAGFFAAGFFAAFFFPTFFIAFVAAFFTFAAIRSSRSSA